MALHLQDPVNIIGDFGSDLVQCCGQLGQLLLALRTNGCLALRKQHLGLEDKSVTHDTDILAPFQHLAQPAKEF